MAGQVLPVIRRKVLGDQLEARLDAMPGPPSVRIHRGRVVNEPDGSAALPYAVLFDGVGRPENEPSLTREGEELAWDPQITVAAAHAADCAQTVDRVCAWLRFWQPVLVGVNAGFLTLPDGFRAVVRPDPTVTPLRYFAPLPWRLDLTT